MTDDEIKATCIKLADEATRESMAETLQRVEAEFGMVWAIRFLKRVHKINNNLSHTRPVRDWKLKNAKVFLGDTGPVTLAEVNKINIWSEG